MISICDNLNQLYMKKLRNQRFRKEVGKFSDLSVFSQQLGSKYF